MMIHLVDHTARLTGPVVTSGFADVIRHLDGPVRDALWDDSDLIQLDAGIAALAATCAGDTYRLDDAVHILADLDLTLDVTAGEDGAA